MSFADWNSGVPVSSGNKQQHGFVCMSTVDDLSYTPSAEERSRDAAQIAATGRRSWKTLKGKGEAVWPPSLEAALIDALEKYQPDVSRSNKTLGRFPMRNRFISDHIFETTGKRRTPKQVGSRLQQLRDTCKEERILQLISRRHPGSDQDGTFSENGERDVSCSPPPTDQAHEHRIVVYLDISVEQPTRQLPFRALPEIPIINNEVTLPFSIRLSPLPPTMARGTSQHRNSNLSGNPLRLYNPTVEFTSPFALVLQSTFKVYRCHSNSPIHTEVAPLKCCSSPMQGSGWRYSSEVVPNYWDNLSRSRDPTKYTLLQELTSYESKRESPERQKFPRQTISIVYYFSYPEEPAEDFSAGLAYEGNISIHNSPPFISQEDQTNWNLRRTAQPEWQGYHHTPSAIQGTIGSTLLYPETGGGPPLYNDALIPPGHISGFSPSQHWQVPPQSFPASRYDSSYY